MNNVQGPYNLVEHSYGREVLTLGLVRGYLVKLLGNAEAAKFLRRMGAEILEQLETIAETVSLEA